MSEVNQLFVGEVFDLYNKKDPDYVFIDVRQPDEWEDGVIPGVKKISLGEIEDHLDQLDKTKKYVMVCRSGGRSNKASSIMKQNGFDNVSNFQGGMLSWYDEESYPLEK
ncbi:MAG: rhodanese-like domain-containing protein [Candidatus Sericytochromatia bacterium]|nr:rhodanese-like domain-containing protein [Candidatus Sericytochromatia bacterium]